MLNNSNRAVQFGKSVERGREGGSTAFPFMYTFVPRPDDQWVPKATATPLTLQNNLNDIGPVIAAGASAQVGVTLDADHPFKLLYIKYTAYKLYTRQMAQNIFMWHFGGAGFSHDGYTPIDLSDSLFNEIRINVGVVHDSQYLYGTTNSFQQNNSIRPVDPVKVTAIQGNEWGWGQLRSPCLLPANGALRFEIYNDSSYDVVVGAMIYGMKVRL